MFVYIFMFTLCNKCSVTLEMCVCVNFSLDSFRFSFLVRMIFCFLVYTTFKSETKHNPAKISRRVHVESLNTRHQKNEESPVDDEIETKTCAAFIGER